MVFDKTSYTITKVHNCPADKNHEPCLEVGINSLIYTVKLRGDKSVKLHIQNTGWEDHRNSRRGQKAAAKIVAFLKTIQRAIKNATKAREEDTKRFLFLEEDANPAVINLPKSATTIDTLCD